MYWTTGSGRIELNITKANAAICSHQGQCDDDVNLVNQLPSIKKQLAKIDPMLLASELKEYGAWDEDELKDHAQNLQRLLWIAAGDIMDGN